MNIQPGTPVSFVDNRGVAWWGTAQSPVLVDNQPWPVVIVKVPHKDRPLRIPARDVEEAHVDVQLRLADAA